LLNTAAEAGAPLPVQANPVFVQRALATGQPVVSDVVFGPLRRRPVVAIVVPAKLRSGDAVALAVGMTLDRIEALLQAQRLRPDWVIGVLDATGTFAARSHLPERFVGGKASPELQ
jgi:hypothetical protein